MEGWNRLVVHVEPADGDDADLERAARQLRQELLDLDVESAELLTAESVPLGAKSGTGMTLTTIAVSMASAGIPPLLTTLHSWAVSRRPRCTLRIEGPDGKSIEIPNLSLERANEVMGTWTRPHGQT